MDPDLTAADTAQPVEGPAADANVDTDPAAATSSDPTATTGKVGALRQRADGLVEQGTKLIDETRATVPPVDIGFEAFERDGQIGGFLVAGAIAFRLFVYLLPLYLIALVVAGALFAVNPDHVKTAADGAGMSSYLTASIADAGATSKKSLWLLVPVTLYAVFSAGLSLHKAVAAAHTRAWGLAVAPKRSALWAAFGVFGFSAIVLGLARFISVIRHGALVPVAMVLAGGLYFALWLAASLRLPRAEGATWWALVPGAVLVGAGTQALYLFNVLYLNRKIESASQAYGVLGVAASALLWLYLLGRLIVAAPVLNATLWHRNKHDGAPQPVSPKA